jgi:hypothetical protein
VVSNKEISEMLAARREGKHPKKDEIHEKVTITKKCSECGTENKENAMFCVGCGESFEEKTVEPEDIKDVPNTKICPSCKSEIPENAKFCVVCGETQSNTAEEPVKVKSEVLDDSVIEIEKNDTSKELDEVAIKLVIQELTLNEEGLKFNKKSMIEGLNKGTELLKYEDIENIEILDESGLETIEIKSNDNIIKIKGVDPDLGINFVSNAQEKIKEAKPEIDAESMDKIEKAKDLLDIGAISEEEFENIKRKILEK